MTHNVWKRISKEDFDKFYDHMTNYAGIARKAFDAMSIEDQIKNWKELFGNKFPDPPKQKTIVVVALQKRMPAVEW